MISQIEMLGERRKGAHLASMLEQAAWELYNASYHSSPSDLYRGAAQELYEQAFHERIAALFESLDNQNRYLDARA